MARPPIQRVSKTQLREIFNRLYLADVLAGRLSETIDSEGPPNRRANEPPGTVSQRVRYWAGGVSVAVCHRYLRPDGTLGGKGLPDPKAVLERGVLHASPKPQSTI
jgi:hypothetical protein